MKEVRLFEKFIKTIDASHGNTKKLFSIGLVGLTGSGKSTVAAAIGRKIGLYIGSNDSIRRFLNEEGFEGESPNQELLQKIAERASVYLYQNKISHIIDADLIKFHQTARKNAEKNGADFLLISVILSEEIILARLQKRNEEIKKNPNSNLSRVGSKEYFRRKELHEELGLPQDIYFTFDNSQELNPQLDIFIEKLKKDGYL